MSENELPPLDEELKALFEAEQSRAAPESIIKARVFQGVQTAINTPNLPSNPIEEPNASVDNEVAKNISSEAVARDLSLEASKSITKNIFDSAILKGTLLFGLGVGTGTGINHYIESEPPKIEKVIEYVQSEAEVKLPVVISQVNVNQEADKAVVQEAKKEIKKEHTKKTKKKKKTKSLEKNIKTEKPVEKQKTRDARLAEERVLLERARVALSRNRPEQAILTLNEHKRNYKNGVMIEEREALAIQALVSLQRYELARKRANKFFVNYPKSFLKPLVKASIKNIPE